MPELLHSLTRSLCLSLVLASLSLALWPLQSRAAMDAAAKLHGHCPSLVLRVPSISPVHRGIFSIVRRSISPKAASCCCP